MKSTKPFLILQLRPEDEASDSEYEAFCRFGNLDPAETVRVRMEREGVPQVHLAGFSGVIVGGGPYNLSDADEKKKPEQKVFEPVLVNLVQDIVASDTPFLGACYGIGALACAQSGVVSKERYSEEVGGVTVQVTDEGARDPLLEGLPKSFRALCGHKEACQALPKGAVLLASSSTCPVQMIRIGMNVYATQFHPELDAEGIAVRIRIYKHAGYFPPEDADALIRVTQNESVEVPMQILARFTERYRAKA